MEREDRERRQGERATNNETNGVVMVRKTGIRRASMLVTCRER